MKPKLLIVELWNLGDLVIATPFLRAAVEKYEVTLLAKPYAAELQARLWPGVTTFPFNAPWTAFQKKYHFWNWPLREMLHLRRSLAVKKFDFGISARRVGLGGDPRDHLLLRILGVKNRLGFPYTGSRIFLTQSLPRLEPEAHRYENWRIAGKALGLDLPPSNQLVLGTPKSEKTVLLHTGARLPVRVWPLENYRRLATRLRNQGTPVLIACDPNQEDWWLEHGEKNVNVPTTVAELITLTDRVGAFIGNDSGPGHLAAICGVPTFTIFGPQLPEWFAPIHPHSEWIEGKACPYKPCSDYCRFPKPFCIEDLTEETVCVRVEQFLQKVFTSNGRHQTATVSPAVMQPAKA